MHIYYPQYLPYIYIIYIYNIPTFSTSMRVYYTDYTLIHLHITHTKVYIPHMYTWQVPYHHNDSYGSRFNHHPHSSNVTHIHYMNVWKRFNQSHIWTQLGCMPVTFGYACWAYIVACLLQSATVTREPSSGYFFDSKYWGAEEFFWPQSGNFVDPSPHSYVYLCQWASMAQTVDCWGVIKPGIRL